MAFNCMMPPLCPGFHWRSSSPPSRKDSKRSGARRPTCTEPSPTIRRWSRPGPSSPRRCATTRARRARCASSSSCAARSSCARSTSGRSTSAWRARRACARRRFRDLQSWKTSPEFDAREKAALALAEAVTQGRVSDEVYARGDAPLRPPRLRRARRRRGVLRHGGRGCSMRWACSSSPTSATTRRSCLESSYRYYEFVMAAFVTVLICSNLIGPAKIVQFELPLSARSFGAGRAVLPDLLRLRRHPHRGVRLRARAARDLGRIRRRWRSPR